MSDAFIKELSDDVNRMLAIPRVWAEGWGRKVGVYGVATRETDPDNIPNDNDPRRSRAGANDALDGFRHAFSNASWAAWLPLKASAKIPHELAKALIKLGGDFSEGALFSEPDADDCGAHMDLHNNKVGLELSADEGTMLRWMFEERVSPNLKMAEAVAEAVRDGRVITRFDDPRMPKVCHPKAKVRGKHYVWRTMGDEKVRSKHAERNGKIYKWNDLPAGELPGQEFECRCTAELLSSDHERVLEENDIKKIFKR